jgi:lambda repressor-like predicted transcriptional regulator
MTNESLLTDLLLGGLIAVGIMIFRQLRSLSESLQSRLNQAAADEALSRSCPKLFFDPRRRSGLRRWWTEMDACVAQGVEPRLSWSDRYEALYEIYADRMPSTDVPLELGLLASQGNPWARIQLVAQASTAFETEGRRKLGLSRMEARYLLDTFWKEAELPGLPLRDDEWNSESVLAYLLRTKWFGGIPADD